MKKYIVLKGQSVIDVCLQIQGNIAFLFQFMSDNGILNIDEDITGKAIAINPKINNSIFMTGTNGATQLTLTNSGVNGNIPFVGSTWLKSDGSHYLKSDGGYYIHV